MTTLKDVSDKLKEPFPPGMEQYRVGATWASGQGRKGIPLAYIDARCVFDRLDEVVGPDNWETHLDQLSAGIFKCSLTVLGVTREDIGMAGDNESEKDKSGASDAIKRAAVQFGIGRYLYDLDLPPVELECKKQGSKETWVMPKGWKPNRRQPQQATPQQPSQQPPRQEQPQQSTPPKQGHLSDAQLKRMFAIAKSHDLTPDDVKKLMVEKCQVSATADLTKPQYDRLCDELIPAVAKQPDPTT